jgi:UDP-glucose 4-epimerase
MRVLVTGGAGYIGSHTIVLLVEQGHQVVVVDNLSNSSRQSLQRVKQITGKSIEFHQVNICHKTALGRIFAAHSFDAVIHFAGLKSVAESVATPLSYYRNNIDSTLTLCEVMADYKVKKLLFSSSATVYGTPEALPLRETNQVGIGITNPYGQTKFMIEQILRDIVAADTSKHGWQISLLRYFNPIGAHASGLIGEHPNGKPNNLLPYVSQVAVGKLDKVRIFGSDYDTPDGTGLRDYIHVDDLAAGHIAALNHMPAPGYIEAYNLGTGKAVSVLQLIEAFGRACGKVIRHEVVSRRPGDIACCYADVSKAERELAWKAVHSIEDACADAWRWQSQNPNGYETL